MLILITALLACTNSGLGNNPTGDTGPDVVECPWVGEWQLSSVKCGSGLDYDKWFDSYADNTMEISVAEGGGCDVEFTWSAAKCAEKEQWLFTPRYPEESTVQWSGETEWINQGISECSPASCTFDTTAVGVGDSPCSEGDREKIEVLKVYVDTSVDNQITVEDLFDDADRADCPLGLVTTWVKK